MNSTKKNPLSKRTDFSLVRETGLEPVRVAPHAPQTCASADSATLAYFIQLYLPLPSALRVEQTRMRGTACGSQNFQRLGAAKF